MKFIHIIVEVRVLHRLDRIARHNLASGIYNTEYRVGSSYVYAYYIRFHHQFFVYFKV